jgi:hypothetical protein
MGYQRSKVDLLWTDAGDMALDDVREDLADTTLLSYRAMIQQTRTRVESSQGDWRLQTSIGANLNRFLGKPNTATLGGQIKNSITAALTSGGFLRASELQVEVFPISKKEIAILVLIQPSGEREQVRLAFSYNSQDNKVVPRNL